MSKSNLAHVKQKYAYKTTSYIDQAGAGSDFVRRQYEPDTREMDTKEDELADPIGDEAHSPVKGIVHRYPDRVLLKPVHACAVYCRFCFRREMVGPHKEYLDADDLEAALAYIRAHSAINEVILTGGDPLILSPRRLANLFEKLADIRHVRVVRIHTRLPLVDPAKINDKLLDVLRSAAQDKALYMCVHVNHADELGDEIKLAFRKLHQAGCVLLSQSVLLKGINDNAPALAALFQELVAHNVKPYYLHHPDKAPGTSHFRVSIKRGQEIMKELRGTISGLCQPTYMLDIPEGHGKVPLTPCYLQDGAQDGTYIVEDPHGTLHDYA